MKRTFYWIGKSLLICACLGSFLLAGDTKLPAAGPIPKQIVNARKVFIGNGGGDNPGILESLIKGGPDRTYDQFYAAIKSAGHYEIVDAPSDADLLFIISLTVMPGPTDVMKGNSIGSSVDPVLRLEIRDPKTNILMWAYVEHMETAILPGNREKNFNQAMDRILNHLAGLQKSAGAATP